MVPRADDRKSERPERAQYPIIGRINGELAHDGETEAQAGTAASATNASSTGSSPADASAAAPNVSR